MFSSIFFCLNTGFWIHRRAKLGYLTDKWLGEKNLRIRLTFLKTILHQLSGSNRGWFATIDQLPPSRKWRNTKGNTNFLIIFFWLLNHSFKSSASLDLTFRPPRGNLSKSHRRKLQPDQCPAHQTCQHHALRLIPECPWHPISPKNGSNYF